MVKLLQSTVQAQQQEQSDTVAVDYVGIQRTVCTNHKILVNLSVSVAVVVNSFIHSTSVLLQRQYVGNVSKKGITNIHTYVCVDPSP